MPRITYGTIALFLVLGAWCGAARAANIPLIVLDKVEDDFGDVHVGARVERQYVVSNQGTAPLRIEYIRTSCGCTTAKAEQELIPPGEKTHILVSYDSAGVSAGKKTQAVLINSNDPRQPVARIRIFATVVHDINLDPQNLVTRLEALQHQVSFPVVGKNASDKPVVLEVSKTRGAVTKAVLSPERVTIAPKSETHFTIELTLSDQEQKSLYPGGVLIVTDYPAEKEIVVPCLIKVGNTR